MTKPFFTANVAPDAQSSLEAHSLLSLLDDAGCFHVKNDLRLPLGIYNVSISRVCDKVTRLCQRLESYFKASNTIDANEIANDLMIEVIDYIELSLYAAAEHVDDLDSIASGFFKNPSFRDKNTAYKTLQKEIKKHKRFISSAANSIKHQQSRIRVFSMDFSLNKTYGCIHGYFIEGVEDGAICPSKKFHHTQDVFSITALVWEILVFLLNCSRELAEFLTSISSYIIGPASTKCEGLSKAVVAASRLPLYTFGEEHPFSRVTFKINSSADNYDSMKSELVGSATNPWPDSSIPSFGKFISRFEGDGKSRSFKFAQPKNVSILHWT